MPPARRATGSGPAIKIVLTHLGALREKYDRAGLARIRAAVDDLVVADAPRGLQTLLVPMDDRRRARALGVAPVTDPGDAAAAKAFADAAVARWSPGYLVLLGSPDVVPMQPLANPLWTGDPVNGDPDETVPSDLPYAGDAPFGTDPGEFRGATRVTGRLPDGTGANDPGGLLRVLAVAAGYRSRRRADHLPVFALTAAVWHRSTEQTLTAVAGTAVDLADVPPGSPPWPAAQTRRRTHLLNLHGAAADPQFYGQSGRSYPVALEAAGLAPGRRLSAGTVVAAECCYGGMLYDPAEAGGVPCFADTYLQGGVYGYCAATNVAYGPADTNDAADIICRDFLKHVLSGASTGRAMLQARQDYVFTRATLSPIDLKTLAQFTLFGDPSVHPVRSAAGAVAPKTAGGPAGGVAARRRRLLANGRALETTTTRAAAVPSELSVRERARVAQALPGAPDPATVLTYDVLGAPAATAGPGERFHVAVERATTGLRAVVGREEDGRLQRTTVLLQR